MAMEIFERNMDDELRAALKAQFTTHSDITDILRLDVVFIHWSDWRREGYTVFQQQGSRSDRGKPYDLALFFSESDFPRPIILDKSQGIADVEWGCATRVLIEHYGLLVKQLRLSKEGWKADGWIPRPDRLTAWAILCQVYLAAHGGDGLPGFERVHAATRQGVEAFRAKTETREWWLAPIREGNPPSASEPWYHLKKLFEEETTKGIKWEWCQADDLFSDPRNWQAGKLGEFVSEFLGQYESWFAPGIVDREAICRKNGSARASN